MKRSLLGLLLVGLAGLLPGYIVAAETSRVTYYIQWVRGGDGNTPPSQDAKLIGPNLSQKLHPVFKWANYWEIKRDSVEVEPGKKVRKHFSPDRDVEIELFNSQELAVRIFRNGKPSRELRQSTNNRFLICGGDKDEDQSWFVVIRRDAPPQP